MLKRILGLAAAALVGTVLAGSAAAGGSTQGSGCIAHRAAYIEGVFEAHYDAGCSGHDEPELDPILDAAGSATDLTWTFVLPTDGLVPVSAVGPTFWFGGALTDRTTFGGQDFLEVQFYPDSVVTNCNPNGAFVVKNVPNAYSVCSPVWSIHTTGQKPNFHEPAAFNAMLTTGSKHQALVMWGGDRISIHFHVVSQHEGWHIDVTDLTAGHTGSGTIVLNSAAGPLLPAYDRQVVGNSLTWGGVADTPNSFVWEIGHTSPFTSPASKFCLPGDPICDSYNAPSWAGFGSPLKIESVTFGAAAKPPTGFAVVSDFGGNAEIAQSCPTVGGPFCFYPFFSQGTDGTLRYGTDYQPEQSNFGGSDQFAQTTDCDSLLFVPDTTYCDTPLQ